MRSSDGVAHAEEGPVSGRVSLAVLYERSGPAAVRLAYLLTGDKALAEDIAQDAFVRVAGRLAHVRQPAAFDAYLRRTVVNLATNHFRRRSVERAFLARQTPEDDVVGVDRGVIERRAMLDALGLLPAKQRAAIVLRFYQDLPEDAAAEILRCRPATVRSLVFRGVKALRAEMERYPDA